MRLTLAPFVALFASTVPAWAAGCGSSNPNCIVPTRPTGDDTNAAASTAFVQNALAGFSPSLVLTQFHFYVGNASNVATDTALSGDGAYGASGLVVTKTNGTPFGTAATQNTGTSGATIPLLNGNNTASGSNTFSGLVNFTSTFQIGGNTVTWPSTTTTVAALNIADQTLSGGANVTSNNLGTVSSGTTTIDCGTRPTQFLTDNGAFTLAAPANDGSCIVLITNSASASTISFSGFSVGSNTGDSLDTTSGHKFSIMIWRVNGTSGYRVAAHQ